jgi:hypothetical protein
MGEYYVYAHINPITKKFFYIGKGKCNRINSLNGRNKHWQNVANKYGFAGIKLADGLTEDQAFEIEIEYIKKHDLQINGGVLVNMTYGGQGMSGHKPTQETISKVSKAKLGNGNPNYGKKTWNYGIARTEEEKKKMSDAKRGVKQSTEQKAKSISALNKAKIERQKSCYKVQCILTGRLWNNRNECMKDLGLSISQFKEIIRPDRKNGKKNLRYLKN